MKYIHHFEEWIEIIKSIYRIRGKSTGAAPFYKLIALVLSAQ
jgi:hypothetical protein